MSKESYELAKDINDNYCSTYWSGSGYTGEGSEQGCLDDVPTVSALIEAHTKKYTDALAEINRISALLLDQMQGSLDRPIANTAFHVVSKIQELSKIP